MTNTTPLEITRSMTADRCQENSGEEHSGEHVLEVRDLSVSFRHKDGDRHIVRNIHFSIPRGRTVALVGESGSGKSLSALSILKLLPYPKAFHPSGQVLFHGQNILDYDDKTIRQLRGHKISIIFQEPMTSLNPLHTIYKQISETLLLHKGLKGSDARKRTLELLELVGIPEAEKRLNSYPHELSGGQKQRVMIAMALANEPELLIADEPTTALDVTVQKQVLELLQELQTKLGMAVLLITHDLNVVRHYAHAVYVMQQGRVVESGPTEQVFSTPQHHYTEMLLNAEPQGTPEPVCAEGAPLLSVTDLRVWFPLKKNFWGRPTEFVKAVQNLSLTVYPGETLGIVGESGSGKTTLGLAILKLLDCQGTVLFDQQAIQALDQADFRPLRKQMQIVFQDPYGSLSPRMSVSQIVAEGLEIHQSGDAETRERAVIQALEDVGLQPEDRHRYPHEFSGGQRQRISIARALVLKPRLIILDEPTSALDRTVQKQVIELLRTIQKKYHISYLFISHDLAVVKALSHRVMVMKSGHVIESGDTHTIFTCPQTDYTRTLMEAAMISTNNQPSRSTAH